MRRLEGDGVTLSVHDEGEGQPVLLIHGFPDSHHLWRHQVEPLNNSGMRVIAPDLRGFGESDRPEAIEDYAITKSVADMVAVLDQLEIEKAHVVGHDWGGPVAWALAAFRPDRVTKLVGMSVGHPETRRPVTIEQRQKSWYMLLFQFSGVAEELLMRNDWQLFHEWLRDDGDVEQYISDLSRPGALTAGLSWYRANVGPHRELGESPRVPNIAAPTMGIWSTGDNYLIEGPVERSAEYVDGPWRYERVEDASHWMQLDQPERVSELLIDFLGSS
jgi:pimeloyl-ACP methyl ester carboxylesterase